MFLQYTNFIQSSHYFGKWLDVVKTQISEKRSKRTRRRTNFPLNYDIGLEDIRIMNNHQERVFCLFVCHTLYIIARRLYSEIPLRNRVDVTEHFVFNTVFVKVTFIVIVVADKLQLPPEVMDSISIRIKKKQKPFIPFYSSRHHLESMFRRRTRDLYFIRKRNSLNK